MTQFLRLTFMCIILIGIKLQASDENITIDESHIISSCQNGFWDADKREINNDFELPIDPKIIDLSNLKLKACELENILINLEFKKINKNHIIFINLHGNKLNGKLTTESEGSAQKSFKFNPAILKKLYDFCQSMDNFSHINMTGTPMQFTYAKKLFSTHGKGDDIDRIKSFLEHIITYTKDDLSYSHLQLASVDTKKIWKRQAIQTATDFYDQENKYTINLTYKTTDYLPPQTHLTFNDITCKHEKIHPTILLEKYHNYMDSINSFERLKDSGALRKTEEQITQDIQNLVEYLEEDDESEENEEDMEEEICEEDLENALKLYFIFKHIKSTLPNTSEQSMNTLINDITSNPTTLYTYLKDQNSINKNLYGFTERLGEFIGEIDKNKMTIQKISEQTSDENIFFKHAHSQNFEPNQTINIVDNIDILLKISFLNYATQLLKNNAINFKEYTKKLDDTKILQSVSENILLFIHDCIGRYGLMGSAQKEDMDAMRNLSLLQTTINSLILHKHDIDDRQYVHNEKSDQFTSRQDEDYEAGVIRKISLTSLDDPMYLSKKQEYLEEFTALYIEGPLLTFIENTYNTDEESFFKNINHMLAHMMSNRYYNKFNPNKELADKSRHYIQNALQQNLHAIEVNSFFRNKVFNYINIFYENKFGIEPIDYTHKKQPPKKSAINPETSS
jgi:hypothetical protein